MKNSNVQTALDFIRQTRCIAEIPDQSLVFCMQLSKHIQKAGKPLDELTISEVRTLIGNARRSYHRLATQPVSQ